MGFNDLFQQYAASAASQLEMGMQNQYHNDRTLNDKLVFKKKELEMMISSAEEQLRMVDEALDYLKNNNKTADLLNSLSKLGVI